jgi:hypothetical protein
MRDAKTSAGMSSPVRLALSPENAHAEHWQKITEHAEAVMQDSRLITWAGEFVEAAGEYEKAKERTRAAAAYEKTVEAAIADSNANGSKGHTGPMGRAARLRPASTDPQNTDDALNEESRAANRLGACHEQLVAAIIGRRWDAE